MRITNKTRLENDLLELTELSNEMLNLQVKLDDNRDDEKTAKALNSIKNLYQVKRFHYDALLKYVNNTASLNAYYLETLNLINKSGRS